MEILNIDLPHERREDACGIWGSTWGWEAGPCPHANGVQSVEREGWME